MGDPIQEITDINTPEGRTSPVFLLYGLRAASAPPLQGPSSSPWPEGTQIQYFLLKGDDWPVAVDLFEIRCGGKPRDVSSVLESALGQLMGQGAAAAWLMFDGVFDGVSALFSDWEAKNTYGICWRGGRVSLAPSSSDRSSFGWRLLLKQAADYIYLRFPSLRGLQ